MVKLLIFFSSWGLTKRNHWRAIAPTVIFATRTLDTNNLKRTRCPIYVLPVVVCAFLVAFADFHYGRTFVPVVVFAAGSILANQFLVITVLSQFFHVVYVLFTRR
jgi:predicted neutral ceramidase superfamily lipid hydrolase